MQESEYDCVIVGGGISGLYIALRVLENAKAIGQTKSICVLEHSKRTGGRIFSVSSPELRQVANIGAMRFIDSQWILGALIDQLDLGELIENHDFPIEYFYLRGRRVYADKAEEFGNGIFRIADSEKGLRPDELILRCILNVLHSIEINTAIYGDDAYPDVGADDITAILKKITYDELAANGIEVMSSKYWSAIKRYGQYNGSSLNSQTLLDLLYSEMSPEAVLLAISGIGYYSIVGLWNAAEAVPWFLNDFSVLKYRTLKGGMECLTNQLLKRVEELAEESDSNIDIFCGRKVEGLVYNWSEDAGGIRRIVVHHNRSSQLSDDLPENYSTRCDQVFLTVGRLAMDKMWIVPVRPHIISGLDDSDDQTIDIGPMPTPDEHCKLRREIAPHPLLKAFLWFNRPWWLDYGLPDKCRLFSDTPVRQVYFCGQNPDDDEGRSLMMVYADSSAAEYWTSLLKTYENDTPYVNTTVIPSPSEKFNKLKSKAGISGRFASRILKWVGQIIEVDDLSPVSTGLLVGAAVDWNRAEYYAGWHAWRAGGDPAPIDARNELSRVVDDQEIFWANEALSVEQGWIEGALRSSERALSLTKSYREPDWLTSLRQPKTYSGFSDYISF